MPSIGLSIGRVQCRAGAAAVEPDIYVDSVAGNNSNAGTRFLPKLTIAGALSIVTTGQTIGLKRGSTFLEGDFNNTTIPVLGFTDYGSGEKPIVDGSAAFSGTWSVYSGNVWQSTQASEIYTLRYNGTWKRYAYGLTKDTIAEGQFIWTAGVLYFNNAAGDPTGATIRVASKTNAFRSILAGQKSFSNIEFRDFKGVMLRFQGATNSIFQNLEFYGRGRFVSGQSLQTHGAILLNTSDGSRVTNCVGKHLATEIVYTYDSNGLLLDGLEVTLSDGQFADTVQIDQDLGLTNWLNSSNSIKNCRANQRGVLGTKGCMHIGVGENDIHQNNVYMGGTFGPETNGNDILVNANLVAFVGTDSAANLLLTWPAGIRLGLDQETGTFDGVTVTNNVVHDCTNGINIQDDSPSVGTWTGAVIENNSMSGNRARSLWIAIPFSGSVRNNIFWSASPTEADLQIDAPGTLVIDFNCYGPDRAGMIVYNGTTYNTFAAWRAAFPAFDAHSIQISATPYVDATNGNFSLKPGSTCKGAASDGYDLGARDWALTAAITDAWTIAAWAA